MEGTLVDSILREIEFNQSSIFTRKSLLDNHLETMVVETRCTGSTPDQTVSE